jgi:hypothetical protein
MPRSKNNGRLKKLSRRKTLRPNRRGVFGGEAAF